MTAPLARLEAIEDPTARRIAARRLLAAIGVPDGDIDLVATWDMGDLARAYFIDRIAARHRDRLRVEKCGTRTTWP